MLHLGVNAWMDANELEAIPTDDRLHKSYTLRAGFILVIQTVIELTRGRDAMRECSLDVIRFFGVESFEEYRSKLVSGEG